MTDSKEKKKSESSDADESFDYDDGYNLDEVYDWWTQLTRFSFGFLQLL